VTDDEDYMNIKKFFQTRKLTESRITKLEREIEILQDQNRRLHFSVEILLSRIVSEQRELSRSQSNEEQNQVA